MKFLSQKAFTPILIILIIAFIAGVIFFTSKQPNQKRTVVKEAVVTEASPSAAATKIPVSTPSASPSSTIKPKPTPTVTPSISPTPKPTSAPVVTNNTPPGAGFAFQNVSVEGKSFRVAIVAADLNSTKVIVDTASDSNCAKDCPVLSLGDYVGRNGAWAGINGSYFCPADYPSCAEKKNSFDTLVMNKNKTYFNSDNNVYSTIPAAIFMAGGSRFISQTLEWGRDTGVDGVIANYPLLVRGGNINFTEAPNEPKFGGAASRTFIAGKGNMIYIGIVYGASMGESAKVLHAMGMQEALNLDQGGSTALWHGGYKAGPGRGIPNAILFVNR